MTILRIFMRQNIQYSLKMQYIFGEHISELHCILSTLYETTRSPESPAPATPGLATSRQGFWPVPAGNSPLLWDASP